MSRLPLPISIVVSTALLAWSGHRYLQQRGDATTATGGFKAVVDQATELTTLRSEAPPESRRARPAPGIAARLAGVVAVAGLPQNSLQNVTPELESPVNAGSGAFAYRRSAVRLTLDPITLPELGRFLQEWRSAEPVWTVTTIDLTPTSQLAKGQQKPLRAALLIETVFAQDTAPLAEGNH